MEDNSKLPQPETSYNNVKLKCDNCDVEILVKNHKEAFMQGWTFGNPVQGLTICFCPACG